MTDLGDHITDDESRRSFLKKSALTSGVAALGLTGAGSAAAQENDDNGGGEEYKALIFPDNFRPLSRFTFVSGVQAWTPNYASVRDSAWSDYNTYQIRWLDTGNVGPVFVTEDASRELQDYEDDFGFLPDEDEPERPAVWQMSREWTPFGDNESLMEIEFNTVDADEAVQLLDADGWWKDDDSGDGT